MNVSLGIRFEGGVQGCLSLNKTLLDTAVVYVGRREQLEPRVIVIVVVPVDEITGEPPRVFDFSEAIGEIGAVLHRFEVRFAIRIVV